jgi:hypothetical protein
LAGGPAIAVVQIERRSASYQGSNLLLELK